MQATRTYYTIGLNASRVFVDWSTRKMIRVEILSSTDLLTKSILHVDTAAFPDDSGWFELFEKHILTNKEELRLYVLTNVEYDESCYLPLIKCVAGKGFVTLRSMENYYTVDYRPICSSESSRLLIKDAIRHIDKNEAVHKIILQPMDEDAPETRLLENELRSINWLVLKTECQVNWIHELDGSYQSYLNGRPKRLRNTIKRKTKIIYNLPNVKLSVFDGSCNIESLIDAYVHVYDRSWKVAEPYPEFIPELIRSTAKRGHLRLGLLTINGHPVAVHFWIVKHQSAYIYKLAHDMEYDKYSPGTVLMAEMIRIGIASDSLKIIDFLSGDDNYKRDWMSTRRVKVALVAYKTTSFKGCCLYAYDQMIRPVRRYIVRQLCRFMPASLSDSVKV